jgi:hypothetical protein
MMAVEGLRAWAPGPISTFVVGTILASTPRLNAETITRTQLQWIQGGPSGTWAAVREGERARGGHQLIDKAGMEIVK